MVADFELNDGQSAMQIQLHDMLLTDAWVHINHMWPSEMDW